MKRKQKRREEKIARREAERAANPQMTASGSSLGGSINMGSSISGFTAGNSETQTSVTNTSNRWNYLMLLLFVKTSKSKLTKLFFLPAHLCSDISVLHKQLSHQIQQIESA